MKYLKILIAVLIFGLLAFSTINTFTVKGETKKNKCCRDSISQGCNKNGVNSTETEAHNCCKNKENKECCKNKENKECSKHGNVEVPIGNNPHQNNPDTSKSTITPQEVK